MQPVVLTNFIDSMLYTGRTVQLPVRPVCFKQDIGLLNKAI